jgi:uncharacterized protein YkwD
MRPFMSPGHGHVRYPRSLVLACWVLLLALIAGSVAQAYFYYAPVPSGQIGVSRPVISQRFVLGDGERFERVKMWLDGAEVTPVADNATGLVSYAPPGPLAAGTHSVKLEVQVSHPKPGSSWYPFTSEFTFTVAADAVATLPSPTTEALSAMAHINQMRAGAGLPSFSASKELTAAAAGHARYQAALDRLTHEQDPSKPLFFGADVMSRAHYYCYTGGVAEVIAGGITTGTAAIDGWMATLYHRLPLVDPGNRDFGYGAADGSAMRVTIVNVGPVADAGQRVRWPYPGQTNVPLSWPGFETPDPFRLYPGVKGPVGYTVTLGFEKRPVSLTLSGAALSLGGAPVSVMSFSPTNDSYLTDTVALIPYKPLTAGTYSVRFTGTVNFGQGSVPYDESWSFSTTGAPAAPPPLPPGPFPDVPLTHPAAGAITHLVGLGVVDGYPDGTYRPAGQITRAEFAKLLTVAAGWQYSAGEPSPFADTVSHWAAQQGYIQAAVRAGAIIGYPDGTFRPQNNITRAEALKTVAASSGLSEDASPPAGFTYTDVGGRWYAGCTYAAHRASLIATAGPWPLWTGQALSGDTLLTRAEAALLISNMVKIRP